MPKRIYSLAVMIGLAVLIGGFTIVRGVSGDCSANSVIKCGVDSLSELRDDYKTDETPGTQDIFKYFGLNSEVINSAKAVSGTVTRSGEVTVNGKVVADNATTAGRVDMPGSTTVTSGKTKFYVRSTATSFQQNSLAAYVFFDKDGRFIGAVIKDCGNPVKAKNKVEPPKPKPVYSCDSLTAKTISRTEFQFNATTTAKDGAKLVKLNYDFGDKTTKSTTSTEVRHSYKNAGSYTAKVTAYFDVNGKTYTDNEGCTVNVTVKDKPKTANNPAVEITKLVNGKKHDTVKPNEVFTYRVRVENTGDVDLKNVEVRDAQPQGVTFVSVKDGYGKISNGVWTYSIPLLKQGENNARVFEIRAKVTNYFEGSIENTACVDATEVVSNNQDKFDDCDSASIDTDKPITKPVNEEKPVVKDEPQEQADELPTTGTTEVVSSVFGLGSLTAAGYYYRAVRRQL